jgi:hypothetical protein
MNHMTQHDHEQMNESNTGDDMSGIHASHERHVDQIRGHLKCFLLETSMRQ